MANQNCRISSTDGEDGGYGRFIGSLSDLTTDEELPSSPEVVIEYESDSDDSVELRNRYMGWAPRDPDFNPNDYFA